MWVSWRRRLCSTVLNAGPDAESTAKQVASATVGSNEAAWFVRLKAEAAMLETSEGA
jgi:hypothetical protein